MTLEGMEGTPVFVRGSMVDWVRAGTQTVPNPAFDPAVVGKIDEGKPVATVPATVEERCLVVFVRGSGGIPVKDTEANRHECERQMAVAA